MRRLRIIHLFFSGHLEMNPMHGDDIKAMNTYFKERQDGRLVHYEGSFLYKTV